ncbi:hypothetical protein QP519_02000 [Weeksella virosa]|uniref:hypothetical protein n=1 Tax=Weeksella virosa TaxID=1014 RepID=UPI00255643E6|nr:hypothetical protein [Weeksella virosa]MDK7374320.1 hypothetical protein [Weeksella virosa]
MHTNTFTLLIMLLVTSSLYAQVGINTENPQQRFHVDGQRDNPTTGSPTVDQQKNDVVITEDGRVGVGTTEPTESLDVNGKARIRNTNTLDSETVSPLYVDENGLLGKAEIHQFFSYYSQGNFAENLKPYFVDEFLYKENNPYIFKMYNEPYTVDANTLHVEITTQGEAKIPAKGTYFISGSILPVLIFNGNDGQEYAHITYDIEVKKEGETSWTSISGGRAAYPRKNLTYLFYTAIFPATIVDLEPGTLVRVSLYCTNTATSKSTIPSNINHNSSRLYSFPAFTLDIYKL